MNKTIISIIVIILLIAGGVFIYTMSNSSNSSQTNKLTDTDTDTYTNTNLNNEQATSSSSNQTQSNKVTVTYDGSSFSPKVVTIKKGDSVIFINQSDKSMSVASNPHPTHTDYPGFDQYKSAEKGMASYTFVFEKVGTWGYHNHLNPSVTGTVKVNP